MQERLGLITAHEAAEELRIHRVTVDRLLREGKLTGVKLANRWLIDQSSLDNFRQHYIGKKGRPKGYSPKARTQ